MGIDPSVNFRWESHVAANKEKDALEEGQRELLGCWICWEYDQKWIEPMVPNEWYKHMRRHFFVRGIGYVRGRPERCRGGGTVRSDIARRYIHEASFATWPAVLDFRATQGPAYTTSIGMMIYETCNFAHTIL